MKKGGKRRGKKKRFGGILYLQDGGTLATDDGYSYVNSNTYYDDLAEVSPYMTWKQTKVDSANFYPLHKRLNTYLENKYPNKRPGDYPRSWDSEATPMEQKHIRDIMAVTGRGLEPDYGSVTGEDKEYGDYINLPKTSRRLARDIEGMSDEDLGKILNTDFSELKGKSMVKKASAIFDLKPKNVSILNMIRYGNFMNSDEFYDTYQGNIWKSYRLQAEDPEYAAASMKRGGILRKSK